MTHLHLLCGPAPGGPAGHLAKLFVRGRANGASDAGGRDAALARLFGVEVRDLAALNYAADGGDAGDLAWFRVDPVHMLAGMHSVTLFDSRNFRLTAEEAGALATALNRHFLPEVEFFNPHPVRWYARFRRPLRVDAPPLDEVAGGTVEPGLIGGPDARALQRTAMEIQMLLHDHPVNAAREGRGEASVNAVWLSGGGVWRRPAAAFDRVLADDFTARALADAAGIPVEAVPEAFPRQLAGRVLAVLEHADPHDATWFEPALRALQRGHLDSIEVTLLGKPGRCTVVDRWQALRFWR